MRSLNVLWLVLVPVAASNIGYYWHVTDFHYDYTYWKNQLSCNDEVPSPGKFGNQWCDSPWLLVTDTITSMATINNGPDFILWTGDNVAHIKNENTTLDIYLEILRNISTVFRNNFPISPVFASLGNHDVYPTNMAIPYESRLYREVAEMWKDWIGNQDNVDVFTKGGYYMAKVGPKIRLLVLNTVLYFRSNTLTMVPDDPAGQMNWTSRQLHEAKINGEKVIITAHVPPGLLVPGLHDWFNPRHKARFIHLMLQYSDIIVVAHFGHDHRDNFKVLQDKSGLNAIAHFSAPSVTPWRHKIPTETGQPHNPGIRLVEYDRDSGRHINYVQYFMNLTDSNREGSSNWTKLYSFKDDYNVEDMSVASLWKIFSRLENGKGLELANKYCTYSLVSNYKQQCTDKERADIYCGGLKYDKEDAQNCSEQYIKRLNAAGIHYLSVLTIIGGVFITIVVVSL